MWLQKTSPVLSVGKACDSTVIEPNFQPSGSEGNGSARHVTGKRLGRQSKRNLK